MKRLLILTAIISSTLGADYAIPTVNRTNLSLDEWWGPNATQADPDTSIYPYTIEFSDEMIADLRSRLNAHNTFMEPLTDVGFSYGFNSNALGFWIDYWANKYNFTAQQEYLNQYPLYVTNIQGLNITFIWIKNEDTTKTVVPLLMLHGFTGSIREFYDAIPLLTADDDSREYVFDLIIPCLPGFGYSDAAVKAGMGAAQVAIVLRNLMVRLGYTEFFLQAGDFGTVISNHLITLFPTEVKGYHTNFCWIITPQAFAIHAASAFNPSFLVAPEYENRMYPFLDFIFNLTAKSGYFHQQATKPDTIGIALTDSPAGLLSYIFEKNSGAVVPTNILKEDGGLKDTFSAETLLDNLMFYWAPRKITSSMRIYAETFNKKHAAMRIDEIASPVPTYVLQPRYDTLYQPALLLRLKYPNLLKVAPQTVGGHYFAMQEPALYAESVFEAIPLFLDWHNNNTIGASSEE